MEFIEFTTAQPIYRHALRLRNELLRLPLGLNLMDEALADEVNQRHFGLVDTNGRLLACLVVVPGQTGQAKIRQVAVDESFQGQGLGRQLMLAVEQQLAQDQITLVTLHAREAVRPFYEKLGYTVHGEPFTEVGILHLDMHKRLAG